MLREKITLCAMLLLFSFSLALAGNEAWLHVRVVEGGENGEKVSVNLPLDLIEAVIAKVDCDELSHGKISIDDEDFDRALIRAVIEAAAESKDATFVTVESEHENVQVRKVGKEIQIHVDDHGEKVKVRVPIAVCEALLQGDDDELNIAAALKVLSSHKGGENLVTIESEDESVRVWIDTSMEGI